MLIKGALLSMPDTKPYSVRPVWRHYVAQLAKDNSLYPSWFPWTTGNNLSRTEPRHFPGRGGTLVST